MGHMLQVEKLCSALINSLGLYGMEGNGEGGANLINEDNMS